MPNAAQWSQTPICPAAEFGALLNLRKQGLSLVHLVHAAHQLQVLLTSLAVQAVMHAHLYGSLNLDELAAEFKLSRFHFAKTYRALTGHAPIQDFIQLKMAHACRLLDEGEQGICQVTERLGNDGVYYFSRLFRPEAVTQVTTTLAPQTVL